MSDEYRLSRNIARTSVCIQFCRHLHLELNALHMREKMSFKFLFLIRSRQITFFEYSAARNSWVVLDFLFAPWLQILIYKQNQRIEIAQTVCQDEHFPKDHSVQSIKPGQRHYISSDVITYTTKFLFHD
jgi:hypothetical protein